MVNKKVLRDTYLEKRLFLSDAEYDRRNQLLYRNFVDSVPMTGVRSFHTFLPITEKKEVNTWLFIHYLRNEFPHILLYTSRTRPAGLLEHFLFTEETRLLVNKWGIPEPSEAVPVVPDHLDIILVPLITCDKQGHRIGYGKGYYDRFLGQYSSALKIGVSLAPPIDKINFMEDLDIALDMCLTPFKTYRFA